MPDADLSNLPEEEIAARLAALQIEPSDAPQPEVPILAGQVPATPRPAAVLIPLLRSRNAWHVLFTRRNAALAEHSGQVAFPGGRADPGDTGPEMTALREAQEEIGLNPAEVLVLGRLRDFVTITSYRVTPVIGVIPWPYPFRLAVEEVSRVFTIPLQWLADPNNYELRQRILPAPYPPVSVVYYRPYDGEVLWGASARFTLALIDTLKKNGVQSDDSVG